MLTNPLTYDRTTRTFTSPTGATFTGTRVEAEAAYVEAVAPQSLLLKLRRLVTRYPQLADRARRAALLVIAQAVRTTGTGVQRGRHYHYELARVQGAGYKESPTGKIIGQDWYSVCVDTPHGFLCDCFDFAEGSAPAVTINDQKQPMCKHILAMLLSEV